MRPERHRIRVCCCAALLAVAGPATVASAQTFESSIAATGKGGQTHIYVELQSGGPARSYTVLVGDEEWAVGEVLRGSSGFWIYIRPMPARAHLTVRGATAGTGEHRATITLTRSREEQPAPAATPRG